ncbi:MAG TPA: outer membrane protein transport protein [Allosphingosinicella sp.]
MSLFGTGAAFLLTAPAPAQAAGFYLQQQSVRGWGRANSGEAADQGPSSLWWNPASIGGQEETEASFGTTIFLPVGEVGDQGTQIDRPGAAPVAVGGPGLLHDPIQRGILPGSAFALRVSDRLALGLVIASPFSFTSDYDPAGWQRYGGIRSRLTTFDVQTSVAYMATDWLSLGAGVNVEYADAFLSNALPNLAPGSADGRARIKGNGWDLGWSAGLQIRPSTRFTIGLAYKSEVDHKLGGTVEIVGLAGPLAANNMAGPTTARFTTPWQLIGSVRAGVTKSLTLNAQAVRFGWSEFDRIDLAAPLGAIDQGYRNSWSLAFGADAAMGERMTLRAGIQFDGTPTRDLTRTPRVPDGDRVDYTIGATLRAGKSLTLDAAAAYTDFEAVPITRDEIFYAGTPAETQILVSGTAAKQHALVVSLGGRMKF